MAGSFAEIVSFFQERHGEQSKVDEEKQIVRGMWMTDVAPFRISVQWLERAEAISFIVRSIVVIPEAKRDAACVLINRINWELPAGNLEMDTEDGEVVARSTFWVADGSLGHEQLDRNLTFLVATMKRYYPAFQKLIWADMSPGDALATLKE